MAKRNLEFLELIKLEKYINGYTSPINKLKPRNLKTAEENYQEIQKKKSYRF